MYTVYTLRTILRLDGIGDWPGGKSAFNCPPTTDMKLGGRVPTTGTTFRAASLPFRPAVDRVVWIRRGIPLGQLSFLYALVRVPTIM